MSAFCVYQPPEGRPGPPVFVQDRFSPAAAVFTPAWLLWRRAWLALGFWIAAVGALVALGRWMDVSGGAVMFGILALCVLVGLEAAPIRGRVLRRRGFRMVALIDRGTLHDAETALFCQTLAGRKGASSPPGRAPAATTAEPVGVFIEGSK